MMDKANVTLGGTDYVILPRDEFDRLTGLAKAGSMPPLPAADEDGNFPAIEYARTSLARKLIRDRVSGGLSQKALAKRAGVREETICRLEIGKHTARIATVDKIARALKQVTKSRAER